MVSDTEDAKSPKHQNENIEDHKRNTTSNTKVKSPRRSRSRVRQSPGKRLARSPMKSPTVRRSLSPGGVLSPTRALSPMRNPASPIPGQGALTRSPVPGMRQTAQAATIRSSPFASPASRRQRSSLYYKAMQSPIATSNAHLRSAKKNLKDSESTLGKRSAVRLFAQDDVKYTSVKRTKLTGSDSTVDSRTEHQIDVDEKHSKTAKERLGIEEET